jgi:hypothetical protein
MYLAGTITQVAKDTLIKGNFSTQVTCTTDAPVPWEATAVPTSNVPFQNGDVEVQAEAGAQDTDYNKWVTAKTTVVVTLKKDKP